MDVSLVTSLYRSSAYLSGFLRQVESCMDALRAQGCSAESVIISNSPDKHEQCILASAFGSVWWREHGRLITVPRETVYASWNRGVRASRGRTIGFWNVDDHRNPAAIIEGTEVLRQGHSVVRFPWLYIGEKPKARSRCMRVVALEDGEKQAQLDPHEDFCLGPFFMFARELFEECGPFDEQFCIAGDYDWQLRIARRFEIAQGKQLGGVFFVDGGNLSASASARLHVEQNVIAMRHALHRPQWPLDARARQLLRSYEVNMSEGAARTPRWSYEDWWSHAQLQERGRRNFRSVVRLPWKVAKSWGRDR
jgi:hypothetical protein